MTPIFLLLKALAPGQRWITVHPNGPNEKGQPILIQPAGDGSYHVIGGAGGRLNYLKLTGVKEETSYKSEAKQRAQTRREEAKRQTARDKAAGTAGSKAKIKEGLKAVLGDERVKLVEAVAEALGWKQEDLAFDAAAVANLSPTAKAKAEKEHADHVMRKVKEAVDFQRRSLLIDAEARQEAGLGEIPLTTSEPGDLSVQDLDPVEQETKGFGFSPDYKKRAEAAGATKESIQAEAKEIRGPEAAAKAEAKAESKEKQTDMGEAIGKELVQIRELPPALDPAKKIEAKQAIAVLKAARAFAMVQAEVRKKVAAVGKADVVEPQAYVVEVAGRPVDQDVVAGLETDLKTIRTRAFLSQVGEIAGTRESLGRYIGVGAYNAVNSLALVAGGASLIDRSVVDVVGVAGASQVLARRLRKDLTDKEFNAVVEAMEVYHTDRYMAVSREALQEAKDWHEMAHEIEIGEARDGSDLATAQELNAKRREFTGNAQRTLGTALGEMEANAALTFALGQPTKTDVQTSLGKTSVENAVTQMRALGLERGDYTIDTAGKSTLLTVHESGLDKLAAPVNAEDLKVIRDSLSIINGEHDEDDWLPEGVSARPDLALNAKAGVAPRLAKPFNPSGDVGQSVADYIGGRAADGDAPADIMAGLLSEDIMAKVDRTAFLDSLNAIAPLYDAGGKMVRAEAYADTFNALADEFVERTYGADRTPLQRQNFKVDEHAMDALHRALSNTPEGVAAFKPVGELTPQDQTALRKVFAKEYAKSDPKAESLRAAVEKLDKEEPAKESEGLFGVGPNPEHATWKAERDKAAQAFNDASMTWGKYVETMGSPQAAYASLGDVVKSNVLRDFADAHNKLVPGSPLKLGRQVISNDLRHLDALNPAAREKRSEDQRRLFDSLRNRVAGKYASGTVAEKAEAARAAEEAASQAQMGLFGATEEEEAPDRPLDMGERYSIGHAAERQIASMMSVVGANFRAGRPSKVMRPTMSGKYVARQRAVKLIGQNKRVMLGMGVGSGKTAIMLSGFSDLMSKGKVKKGLFAVPSVVQGEFHGAALSMLEPGKFKWHADPGASRESRLKAYKDPENNFTVVTHQGLREDFDHIASGDGMTAGKFDVMSPADRKTYAKGLMDREGWNLGYFAVDEGHNLLNRAGKANSHLANVMDAISGNSEYHVMASADPVKNDASEAFDLLAKMEPQRYTDRDAFMRKYGVDTEVSRDALRREMARHVYSASIDPGVKGNKTSVDVEVSKEAGQTSDLKAIDDAASSARLARMHGTVDVQAMKVLAPFAFQGVDSAGEAAVAKRLQEGLPMIHQTALQHAIDDGAKTEALSKLANERRGKPGVVFAHRLDRVDEISKRLTAEGHRVVVLSGADSSKEKDQKKADYQAGKYDILVASDAGAVGANLQAGKWLVQYDTPMTAMLHAQRNGRIHRMGQTSDVELIDLVANHPAERRNRDRLSKKYALRSVMTSPQDGLDDQGLAGYLSRARAGKLEAGQKTFDVADTDIEPTAKPGDQMELAA